jgi:hypothetical protein
MERAAVGAEHHKHGLEAGTVLHVADVGLCWKKR